MEQRWHNLKQIHEAISKGKKDNVQNFMSMAETKRLIATLKVLLSLEMKSCDEYPSRCLHCHQLLALSVVTMIFEDHHLNVLNLFYEHLDEDFLNVLVNLMFSKRDPFLVYSSQKAVLALLNSELMLKKQKANLLEKIVIDMELKEHYQIQSVLEIITSALSGKSSPNFNEVCFNLVCSELTKILHIWKKYQKELDYYVFSLLRKFVKYLNKSNDCVKSIENFFHDAIMEFLPVLFSDSSEFKEINSDNNHTQSKITTRKLLDLLNEFFNYSSHLVLKKNVADIYVILSGNIIHHLTNCDSNIDLFTNCVGFTGAIESTSQIDFPLTRRMTLLSLKCFAVTIKHDVKRCIGDVVNSLQIFLDSMTVSMMASADSMSLKWLPHVFEDQDDSYIECVLCLLDIYSWLNIRHPDSTILYHLDPCPLFFQLLQTVNFDPSIIMDWLVSPETCFLLYFSRLLKYVINNWFKFLQAAHVRYGVDCKHSEPIEDKVSKDDPVFMESVGLITYNGVDRNPFDHSSTHLEDKEVNQGLPNMSPSNCIHGNLAKEEKRVVMQGKVDNNVMTLTSSMASIMNYSDSDDDSGNQEYSDKKSLTEMISHPNEHRKDALEVKSIDKFEPRDCQVVNSYIDLGSDSANTAKSQNGHHSSELSSPMSCKNMPCEMKCCDQTMSMFIRVRIQIERLVEQDLFPYNPSPLLSLLCQCEDLYESTE